MLFDKTPGSVVVVLQEDFSTKEYTGPRFAAPPVCFTGGIPAIADRLEQLQLEHNAFKDKQYRCYCHIWDSDPPQTFHLAIYWISEPLPAEPNKKLLRLRELFLQEVRSFAAVYEVKAAAMRRALDSIAAPVDTGL